MRISTDRFPGLLAALFVTAGLGYGASLVADEPESNEADAVIAELLEQAEKASQQKSEPEAEPKPAGKPAPPEKKPAPADTPQEPSTQPTAPAPAGEPSTAVRSLLEELTGVATPKEMKPKGDPPAEGSVGDVLDDLVESDAQRREQRRQQALALFQESEQAMASGKLLEALRLARTARQLDPSSPAIRKHLAALEQELAREKTAVSVDARAKARLAAGLSRGQVLLQAGRYSEAEDLLVGVQTAAKLFPRPQEVVLYHRLAERELDWYRKQVEAGRIIPDVAESEAAELAELAANDAEVPVNARRVLRGGEGLAPDWYARKRNLLATRVTVDFRQAQLGQAVAEVARQTGVPIEIDPALVRANTDRHVLIDFRAGDLPGENVLDLICQKGGVEYVLLPKAVVVTTARKAVLYLRELPESLQNAWLTARLLFPESDPTAFAGPPSGRGLAAPTGEEGVPAYLRSGDALVTEIQSLLR